jgi:hypothetical protein
MYVERDISSKVDSHPLSPVADITSSDLPATWVAGAIAAVGCLLDNHLLIVFTSGLTVYSPGLVSFAALVGRSRQLTGQSGYWRAPLHRKR